MQLDGLHHVTMITADAQRNVAFWAGTMGLRLVKKTVNFDAPEAYHLYFGDERGAPGSILTWFEFAGAQAGSAGDGMVHTLELGVPSAASLEHWSERLRAAGTSALRDGDVLRFADPDGLPIALVVADATNPRLQAASPDVPAEHAITGIEGARAYGQFHAVRDGLLCDVLGFGADPDVPGAYALQGPERVFRFAYDAPEVVGRPGAGTVHHIAWASRDEDHLDWQAGVRQAGGLVTDVKDRDYFDAIYFREPHGILFEIATLGPGFAADEDPAHLGEALRLPAQHEHLRSELESTLRPVDNPRAAAR